MNGTTSSDHNPEPVPDPSDALSAEYWPWSSMTSLGDGNYMWWDTFIDCFPICNL